MLTRLTPEDVMQEALADCGAALVVGGHTHQQAVRALADGRTYVNAGSVGMPYEGRRGAFWLVLHDRRPELRETRYDIDAAVEELRASSFRDVDSQLQESLLEPADPSWVAAFSEHSADRGPAP